MSQPSAAGVSDVIDVHLRGTFLVSQAFAKQAVSQGQFGAPGARIVNTTSVSGMMGNFGQANYAAAKAGIYGLTRTLSIELQKHKITVNAIAPIAKTRMTEDLPMFQGASVPTRRRAMRPMPPAASWRRVAWRGAASNWIAGAARCCNPAR